MENQVQDQLLCAKCGAHYYSVATYCGFDGSELLVCQDLSITSITTRELAPTGRECKECLHKFPPQFNFCPQDGARLQNWNDYNQPDIPSDNIATSSSTVKMGTDVHSEKNSQTEHSLVGQILDGKYSINSVFAEGGMAMLYQAQQISVDRTVLIKVMHSSAAYTKGELQRFEQEAKLLAKLNHPNIVSVYDFGFLEQRLPYLVMEQIPGLNLAEKLRAGALGPKETLRIMMQLCRGLQEAHKLGIVHRDLKPENIILNEDSERPDWVKIVDFGIAHTPGQDGKRLTLAGMIMGTPAYMAPELFSDNQPGPSCDIYSLGVIMFELLTGNLPFSSKEFPALIAKVLQEPAPSFNSVRPEIPPDTKIEKTVQKCLEKNPANRFTSVGELLAMLQELSLG